MAVARREYFGKLLEPGLRKIFYEVYDQIPSMIGEIYNVQTTSNPSEEDVSIGTMGDFNQFQGTVEYDRPYEGYNIVYDFPEYAKGFRIERKLYDDDRYNQINKQPAGLAISAARRREADAASLFINSFATANGPDGQPLCSTAHPSRAFVDSGGTEGIQTRSNRGALPLNHANLQTTKNLMRAFVDDRGGRISVVPDTLLVPVALEETAWELIESAGKVNTSDNNPNIHQGKYKLMVWDYLTDDEDWWMIDSRYAKLFLNWFDRVSLEFAMEEDFDTLAAKYRAYMRYNCGFSDWIWIYGNHPV
jgi:phage major head subunit gpT-like protein